VLNSGVHATIAGILLAFTIPARNSLDKTDFLQQSRFLLDQFEKHDLNSAQAHHAIHALEQKCEMIESPLHRIEHALQPWVAFLIMPIFAFANAGVHILGKIGAAVTHPITLGVLLGLLLGKPLGITLFARLASITGVGSRPASVSWAVHRVARPGRWRLARHVEDRNAGGVDWGWLCGESAVAPAGQRASASAPQ
jgi:NhaA family Na+:H+ antiporter